MHFIVWLQILLFASLFLFLLSLDKFSQAENFLIVISRNGFSSLIFVAFAYSMEFNFNRIFQMGTNSRTFVRIML